MSQNNENALHAESIRSSTSLHRARCICGYHGKNGELKIEQQVLAITQTQRNHQTKQRTQPLMNNQWQRRTTSPQRNHQVKEDPQKPMK
jgi:hypothetical protein